MSDLLFEDLDRTIAAKYEELQMWQECKRRLLLERNHANEMHELNQELKNVRQRSNLSLIIWVCILTI